MTKREELILLDQINNIIISAGLDSYIGMTFAGIVDVCKENIENDFGNQPVRDLADERMAHNADERRLEMKKNELDAVQKMCKDALDEVEELRKRYHALELDCKGMEETMKAKSSEIEKLGTMLDGKVAECERLRDERDAMSDSCEGLGEIIDEMEKETIMLKAELKQYIRGDIIAEIRTDELHRVIIERGIYGEFLVGTQEHITADSSCKWEYMQNGWRWHDLEYRKSEDDARKRFADYVRLECED